MKYGLIVICITLISQVSQSQNSVYSIDTKSSEVKFSVKHLGILNVEGVFQNFEGVVTFQNKCLNTINGVIHVKSIDTNDDSRDKILLSESYFDSDTYATIQFESDPISKESKTITGRLTIKNITRPIILKILTSEAENELKLKTSISRKDFKLHFGSMEKLVGETVTIQLLVVF